MNGQVPVDSCLKEMWLFKKNTLFSLMCVIGSASAIS